MRLVISRAAQNDVEEIGEFISLDNPARAESFIDEIEQRWRQICDFPKAAPSRSELGRDVRMSVLGQYLILYEVIGDDIKVLRVVHGARDIRSDDL